MAAHAGAMAMVGECCDDWIPCQGHLSLDWCLCDSDSGRGGSGGASGGCCADGAPAAAPVGDEWTTSPSDATPLTAGDVHWFLARLCRSNATSATRARPLTCFDSMEVPAVSIPDYVDRLARYTEYAWSTIVQSVLHLARLAAETRTARNGAAIPVVSLYTFHRAFLAILVVTAKLHEDHYFNNEWLAHLGGVTLKELNVLEVQMIRALDYNVWIGKAAYEEFATNVRSMRRRRTAAGETSETAAAAAATTVPAEAAAAAATTTAEAEATEAAAALRRDRACPSSSVT